MGVGLEWLILWLLTNKQKLWDAYAITKWSRKIYLEFKNPVQLIRLKVSYIGFQTIEKLVTTGTTNMNYPVVLKEGTHN